MTDNNKTPFIIKLLIVGSVLAALISTFIAFTPLRMFGIIPLVLTLVVAGIILMVQYKKGRPTLWPLLIMAITTFGLTYAVVTQIVDKPEVAKDEKFEQEMQKSAEEGTDELDDLLDELE